MRENLRLLLLVAGIAVAAGAASLLLFPSADHTLLEALTLRFLALDLVMWCYVGPRFTARRVDKLLPAMAEQHVIPQFREELAAQLARTDGKLRELRDDVNVMLDGEMSKRAEQITRHVDLGLASVRDQLLQHVPELPEIPAPDFAPVLEELKKHIDFRFAEFKDALDAAADVVDVGAQDQGDDVEDRSAAARSMASRSAEVRAQNAQQRGVREAEIVAWLIQQGGPQLPAFIQSVAPGVWKQILKADNAGVIQLVKPFMEQHAKTAGGDTARILASAGQQQAQAPPAQSSTGFGGWP